MDESGHRRVWIQFVAAEHVRVQCYRRRLSSLKRRQIHKQETQLRACSSAPFPTEEPPTPRRHTAGPVIPASRAAHYVRYTQTKGQRSAAFASESHRREMLTGFVAVFDATSCLRFGAGRQDLPQRGDRNVSALHQSVLIDIVPSVTVMKTLRYKLAIDSCSACAIYKS